MTHVICCVIAPTLPVPTLKTHRNARAPWVEVTQDLWTDDMAEYGDVFASEQEDNISLQISDFGCHLTWKELDRIDGLVLKMCQRVLCAETWDYSDRPTYFTAVRNLQGFIEYKLDNEEEAEAFFQTVLDHDPVNINALGNMVHLHKEKLQLGQCRRFLERLRDVFASSGSRHNHCQSFPRRARAYADRAHAIRYFEQDKRCFRYMKYVERAATIGRFCHDAPERAEWFFDHALALYRRDVQMLYLRKISGSAVSDVLHRKIRSGFEKAVRLFYDVIRLSTSRDYLALSWIFIGIMLNNDAGCRTLDYIVAGDCELNGMSIDGCFRKGLEINDSHELTTGRVGAEYVKMGRYLEAKRLLDRSIGILGTWIAHHYRGVLFLRVYEDQTVPASHLLMHYGIETRTSLLHMAKREFEKAQEKRSVHADWSNIGQVHFLLGEYKLARHKFKKALDSEQDDYFDILQTYQRWIRCIGEENTEEVAALKSRAEDHRQRLVETPLDTNGDSFSDDFEHYSRSALPGHVRLLTEADFWVASATGRTRYNSMCPQGFIPPRQYNYDFFLAFNERDRIWSFALLAKLETEYGLRGCVEQRDFIVGDDLIENTMRCLRESHRCVLVLSQHFVQDADLRAVVREALRVGFRREGPYVLPLVLTDCEVSALDPRLREVRKIECNLGQIPIHHWNNLVASLRQQAKDDIKNLHALVVFCIISLTKWLSDIPLD